MSDVTVVVRVDDGLRDAFAKAAKAIDRTTSQLLRDFMRDFVRKQAEQAEYDDWVRQKVETGRAAIRAGHIKSNDEVEAYFAQRRAASLRNADETGL